MTFGKALLRIEKGDEIMFREGWNGKNMFVTLMTNVKHVKHVSPYYAIRGVDQIYYPWQPSQQDMLANDWCTSNFQGDVCSDYKIYLT